MENRKKDACEEDEEVGITDLEALVPQDHLLRKIEKVEEFLSIFWMRR